MKRNRGKLVRHKASVALYISALAFSPALAAQADDSGAIESEIAVKHQMKSSWLTFGARMGDEQIEGFSDLIYPLIGTEDNVLFFNPRFALKDEGANEANVGIGYRRKLTDWLVGGANVYFDSQETSHHDRFNQWGAGVEVFTKYVDLRANYYDADNDEKMIGAYQDRRVSRSSKTSALTRTTSSTSVESHGSEDFKLKGPYAENHEIYYDISGEIITDYTTTVTTATTYRTTTTITTTDKFFERFETGLDGWDAELGFKVPTSSGPEIRLYGGYYDYDNPYGDDVSGTKGKLEIKTGRYFGLDAEVFEDDKLHGSDYYVGFRLQVPLSKDLTWQNFKQGLFSMQHRDLDSRMRSEMVMRDVAIKSEESDWKENEAKRKVDVQRQISQRTESTTKVIKKSETIGGEEKKIPVKTNITFVDGDIDASDFQDGTNEHPFKDIQEGVDDGLANNNNIIFVYEKGGTGSVEERTHNNSADSAGGSGINFYNEQVVLKEVTELQSLEKGQTLTSIVSWEAGTYDGTAYPAGSYHTVDKPVIKPDAPDPAGDQGWEQAYYRVAAAVTMANNSTVRRMKIDTRELALFNRHGYPYSDNETAGIFCQLADKTEDYKLTIEDNIIETDVSDYYWDDGWGNWHYTGKKAYGIEVFAQKYHGNLELDINKNKIETSGQSSDGIHVDFTYSKSLDPSSVKLTHKLDIVDNEITINGFASNGMYFQDQYHPDEVELVDTITGNTITVNGGRSTGIKNGWDTGNYFDENQLRTDNTFIIDPGATGSIDVKIYH